MWAGEDVATRGWRQETGREQTDEQEESTGEGTGDGNLGWQLIDAKRGKNNIFCSGLWVTK